MKRTISTLLLTIISLVILGLLSNKVQYNKPVIRDIELTHKEIDYQSFFNDLKDQEINLDRSKSTIEYKATKELDANLFNEIDFVNYAPNKNKVEFDYQMKYDANENKFTLSIIAKTDKGKVIDNWEGTPFVKENKEIDIVFATDSGLVYLSDLEAKGLINNCGWFSRLFRKIAKVALIVAVVATVVAVAVVAAPVVAAAIPALAGGAVALSGGIAAGSMATAAGLATTIATTATVVAATSVITALINETISLSVNTFRKQISSYNYKTKSSLSKKEISLLLKKAIKYIEKNKKNTCVYLGRNPEYINVAHQDTENNVIYFKLSDDEWNRYVNKYDLLGMWILNEAFINACILAEKSNGWKFRLATDYDNYLKEIPLNEPGGFYSRELLMLKNSNHIFSKTKTKGLFYNVYST